MMTRRVRDNAVKRDMMIPKANVTANPRIGPEPNSNNTADPIKMYLADVMTVPASIAGLPAMSVPAGVSSEGLPIGVQLIGNHHADHSLLMLAQEVEELA